MFVVRPEFWVLAALVLAVLLHLRENLKNRHVVAGEAMWRTLVPGRADTYEGAFDQSKILVCG